MTAIFWHLGEKMSRERGFSAKNYQFFPGPTVLVTQNFSNSLKVKKGAHTDLRSIDRLIDHAVESLTIYFRSMPLTVLMMIPDD